MVKGFIRPVLCQAADTIQNVVGKKSTVIIIVAYEDERDGGPTVEGEHRGDRISQLGILDIIRWKLAQDANEGPDVDSYKIKERK